MKYKIDKTITPWTCFPEHLDTSGFINISTLDNPWGKFLNAATGKVHDCSDYAYAAVVGADKEPS